MAFGDLVQSAQNSGASGNASATYGGAPSAGNLLIFGVARSATHTAGGSWGTPTGFTLLANSGINVGNMGAAWFYKIAAGTEGAISLAGVNEAGTWRAVVLEYEGPFHASSPLDQVVKDVTNLSTVVTSQASGTTDYTAQINSLAVAFFGADQAANVDASRTYSNSFVESIFADAASSPARAGVAVARRVLAAIGTYSCTFSVTDTGDEMVGSLAVFRAAVSGSSPSVSLDTADATTFGSSTPSLEFTGTDADGDDIRYEVQISDNPSFTSGTTLTYDSSTILGARADLHPNPTPATTWQGNGQVDDRPGQSFQAGGGTLHRIVLNAARDELDTNGTWLVRVYNVEPGTTYGVDNTPENPATAANTPTPDWLVESDGIPLDGTMSASDTDYNHDFSGAARIHLSAGSVYMAISDWVVPPGEASTNTIEIHGDTDTSHAGNAWVDGDSANYGVRSDFDVLMKVYEVQTLTSKFSNSDAGFANTVAGGDSDPFTSGQKVRFTVQAGDALGDGLYYWRARGLDPAGTGAFGSWTASQTFTVDTSGGGNGGSNSGDITSMAVAVGVRM